MQYKIEICISRFTEVYIQRVINTRYNLNRKRALEIFFNVHIIEEALLKWVKYDLLGSKKKKCTGRRSERFPDV